MVRRGLVAALAAVLCMTLVACSDDNAASTTPKPGGTLRLGTPKLTTLDPARAATVEEQLLADQLFNGLTAWDPKTLEPKPSLAKSWNSTPDLKTWAFILNGNAKFSNGQPLQAEDVRYSLSRVAQKAVNSPAADSLSSVSGYAAVHDDGTTPDLSGVSVLAPDIVQIVLDRPVADLPRILGNPAMGVVSAAAVNAPKPVFGEAPITSGPFRYQGRSGSTIRLVKAKGARAYVNTITVQQFATDTKAYQAFVDGRLDWVRVPPQNSRQAAKDYGSTNFTPYIGVVFYGFNLKSPKLTDPRFRQAILRSIDREKVVKQLYRTSVEQLDSVVVGDLPGWTKQSCGTSCAYSKTAAKKLLKEAFPDGNIPTLVLAYDTDATQAKVAKAIQSELKATGIKVDLVAKPFAEYGDYVVKGEADIMRLGWIASYPSADGILPQLFTSGSADNVTGYSNPDVDAKLSNARGDANEATRNATFETVEKAVLTNFTVIPIAQIELYAVTAKNLHGVKSTLMGTFDATKVWLDQ